LHIECLPDRIPASVQVDTSSLAEEGQGIHVQDIVLGEGITVLDDPEHVIVKVSVLRIEKIEVVEKVAEVAEVAVEAAEGAPSPEGESKEEKRGKGERPTNR
jgi:hypothetical protein